MAAPSNQPRGCPGNRVGHALRRGRARGTEELAANLTREDVAEMESKGLTLGDAEHWRKLYQAAVDAAKGSEQAKARLALMNKIIRIMVGGR
jgi:hypothetical protein